MTEAELRALISAGESFDVEFKGSERRPPSDAELVEAVVCLANRSGDRPGYLLVGVEDDGRITGARPRHDTEIIDPARVQALISARTRPSLGVDISLLKVEGKPVIVIRIPPLQFPVGTTDGKYLRRALGGDGKPACLPIAGSPSQERRLGSPRKGTGYLVRAARKPMSAHATQSCAHDYSCERRAVCG